MEPFVRIVVSKSMVKVSIVTGRGAKGGGRRGVVTGFSRKARKRMMEALHSLSFEGGLLLTLTYGADYPVDGRVYKSHLQAMRKRLEERLPGVRAVWRLEFQERGAPHYHIFLLDEHFLDIKGASRDWHSITGSEDPNHLAIGVDIKPAWTGEGVRNVGAYISKYISKVDCGKFFDERTTPGRFWGVWGEKVKPEKVFAVSVKELERVLEAVGRVESVFCGEKGKYAGVGRTTFLGAVGQEESGGVLVDIFENFDYAEVGSFFRRRRVDEQKKRLGCMWVDTACGDAHGCAFDVVHCPIVPF